MIRDDIKTALVSAMKSGDKGQVGTMRCSVSVEDRDIELRTAKPPTTTRVTKPPEMIKQRRESAEMDTREPVRTRPTETAEIARGKLFAAQLTKKKPPAIRDNHRNRRHLMKAWAGHGRGEARHATASNRRGKRNG